MIPELVGEGAACDLGGVACLGIAQHWCRGWAVLQLVTVVRL